MLAVYQHLIVSRQKGPAIPCWVHFFACWLCWQYYSNFLRKFERAKTRYEVDTANWRGDFTTSRPDEVKLFAYFLSGRWTKQAFQGRSIFSGCLVAIVMLLSGLEGDKLFSLFFFSHIASAPQHLAEGWTTEKKELFRGLAVFFWLFVRNCAPLSGLFSLWQGVFSHCLGPTAFGWGLTFRVDDGQKRTIQRLKVFSDCLVAIPMLLSGLEGNKRLSLWKFFYILHWPHSIWLRAYFLSGRWTKKDFSEAESFFWLFGRNCNASIRSTGE